MGIKCQAFTYCKNPQKIIDLKRLQARIDPCNLPYCFQHVQKRVYSPVHTLLKGFLQPGYSIKTFCKLGRIPLTLSYFPFILDIVGDEAPLKPLIGLGKGWSNR